MLPTLFIHVGGVYTVTRPLGFALALSLLLLTSPPIHADQLPQFASQPASLTRQILFEANQAQTQPQVRLFARTPLYHLLLTDRGATLRFQESAVTMTFLNAAPNPHLAGASQSTALVNYFRGSDPQHWHRNVPLYERAEYSHLYPGIQASFYGSNGAVEYDFQVAPYSDPASIRLKFESTTPTLSANGDLVLPLLSGELRFHAPSIYQLSQHGRSSIEGGYQVHRDGSVTFALGPYDRSQELVIDPVISYSTFLGGSEDEGIFGIRRDREGNIYLSGETSSIDFPLRNGLQSIQGGDYDAFVSKFDPSGTRLIYSTYLGGSGYDHAVGLAVNRHGEAFIAGLTTSANFPIRHPLQASLKGSQNAFVAHLASSGSELIFSTYLGGSNSDGAQDIVIDPASNVFLAGQTNSTDFPTTPGAFQTMCGGPGALPGTCSGDGFVTKLSADGSRILYSTFLGGQGFDTISGITLDRAGNAIVTGQTLSTDLPLRKAFQAALAGFANAFLTKLNATGTNLEFSTYLGGSQFDSGNAVALGPEGVIWVTGTTSSPDFPLVSPFQSTISSMNAHAFISEFTQNGTALRHSSFFGGTGFDYPFRIGVDAFGSPSVTGFTTSTDLPVTNALQTHFGGGYADAFALKILPNSFTPLYATYLGGTGDDFGYGIYQEPLGTLWFGGSTSSQQFPIRNAFQPAYAGGPYDAYLTRVSLTLPDYLRILQDVLGHTSTPGSSLESNLEQMSNRISEEDALTPQQLAERLAQAAGQR